MPRGGTGTCTTPAGQPVVAGTVISDTVFNALVADIYTILTDSLSRTGSGSMSVPLGFFDGVIGAPGISFANEGASGLYRAGANDIRMSINGVDRAKWSTTGFLAAAADIAVLDRAGTIGIGTTSGTTITIGRAGQSLVLAGNASVSGTLGVTGTADIPVIDRAGTVSIGGTSGTTVTVGRAGQTLSLPGTVDAAVVDRAGTISVGATSGTTITIGRSGQTVDFPGTVTSPSLWRTVVTTGDTSCSSNVTPVDITGMTFAMSSGRKYLIRSHIFLYSAASTTGFGISAKSTGAPTTSTVYFIYKSWAVSSTTPWTITQKYSAFNDTPTVGADSSATVSTEPQEDEFDGYVVTTGAGTFQLRLLSEVNLSAVTVKAGSYLEYLEFT